MTTRLVIEVDVDDSVDPTLVDPHDVAENVVDLYDESRRFVRNVDTFPVVVFVGAEWSTG
jgi:hypothetical protein